MRYFTVAMLFLFCIVMAAPMAATAAQQKDYPVFASPGEKIPLGSGNYFVYGFVKQPKLGTAIMKVEIFKNNGSQDTSFIVKGEADMPSMRGAHAEGDKKFSVSKKGAYLLPVRLVMPGDWEVKFTFMKKDKTILEGIYLFDL